MHPPPPPRLLGVADFVRLERVVVVIVMIMMMMMGASKIMVAPFSSLESRQSLHLKVIGARSLVSSEIPWKSGPCVKLSLTGRYVVWEKQQH